MKRFFLLLILSACFLSAQAQNKSKTKTIKVDPPRPKVGVVLCGGGAKGAVHIGVLKYIEEMGIPVDYVAGTSMGSILGGLYAMGYSPEELTQLISQMDWSAYIGNKIDRSTMSEEVRIRDNTTIINLPFGLRNLFDQDTNSKLIEQLPSAYVNNSSLINLFNDLCIGYQEDMDFNDMPIPFACVATDLVTGQEVVLRHGNMPTAMRASMAIPGVFAPVPMGDMLLVDGGLVNNFPADVLREMGADIIIGVEVTSEKTVSRDELKSLPQVLARLVTNSTSSKRKENRELCNIRIVPDISGFGMLSFTPTAIDTLVKRGYKMATQYHDQFMTIKEALDQASPGPIKKELHAPKAKNLAVDSILVSSIEINGVPDRQSRWLIRKGELKPGMKYVQNDIEQAISIYRGTGCFDDITYNVKENDSLHSGNKNQLSESYGLTINLKPAHPHVLGVGMRYDTEDGAALLLDLGLNEKKFGGSKLSLSAKLSYNPKIDITYTLSRSSLANFNLSYDYRNEHFAIIMGNSNNKLNQHYQQHKLSGYISQFHLLDFSTAVGVSYTSIRFDRSSMDNDNLFDTTVFKANQHVEPFVTVKYDNLDDANFARQGFYARLATHVFIEPKSEATVPFDISYTFIAPITPNDGKFTIIPQVYGRYLYHGSIYFNLNSVCGNEIPGRHFEEQMPFIGINQIESLSNNSTILRCDLRYNFFKKHYLTATYNTLFEWDLIKPYFGMQKGDALYPFHHGVGLKYSYNSMLGPISLTGQWSTITKSFSGYFSIGYTF